MNPAVRFGVGGPRDEPASRQTHASGSLPVLWRRVPKLSHQLPHVHLQADRAMTFHSTTAHAGEHCSQCRPNGDPASLMSRVTIDPVSGCWIWTGAKVDGYGQVKIKRKVRYVHVVMWELHNGPVPPGRELDHFKCENRACCNPQHVRPVTLRENQLRGDTVSSRMAARRNQALRSNP
jgi:hypothetical protein